MSRGILACVLLAPLVVGCAISKDGVGFASKPHAVQGGVLIVGTTGPLRTLDDTQRGALTGGAASKEKIAGWASIQTFSIPLVLNVRYRVLVPASVAQDTHFASAAASFVFGASGDLVAARSDPEGLLWIDRVLCKADRTYQACAQKYSIGVFSENTGRELGRDYRLKPDGEWVDISSYLRLSKDPEHHAASELDVRAINRCDDCKVALPGSVQSSVAPPP